MPRLVVALTTFPPSLVENTIVSLATGPPFAFVTVAVAVLTEDRLATIEAGETPTLTFFAGRGAGAVWVSAPLPDMPADWSLAVIVTAWAVPELVIVAV